MIALTEVLWHLVLLPVALIWVCIRVADRSYRFAASRWHGFVLGGSLAIFTGMLASGFLDHTPVAVLPAVFAEYDFRDFWPLTWFRIIFYCGIYALIFIAVLQNVAQIGDWLELLKLERKATELPRSLSRALEHSYSDSEHLETIQLRQSSALQTPATWGLRAPMILFPPNLVRGNFGSLERVFVHELAHVRRRDWGVQELTRFICAWLWPLWPLRSLRKKLSLNAEFAADDAVLSRYPERSAYAEDLLRWSQRLPLNTAAVNFHRYGQTFERIDHVLDGRMIRDISSRRYFCQGFTVFLALSLVLSSIDWQPIPSEVMSASRDVHLNLAPVERLEEGEEKNLPLRIAKPIFLLSPQRPDRRGTESVDVTVVPALANNSAALSQHNRHADIHPKLEVRGALPQSLVMPRYPRQALGRGVEANIRVRFDIDPQGQLVNLRFISGSKAYGFRRSVRESIEASHYIPMMLGGIPTTIKNVEQTYVFTLDESAKP